MAEALLLATGQLSCLCGVGWFALAMSSHWQQVKGARPLVRNTSRTLRVLGSAALLASLLLFLRVDHASMASLVWVMSMAFSAFVIAFTLAWRPRWLSWLVVWARD